MARWEQLELIVLVNQVVLAVHAMVNQLVLQVHPTTSLGIVLAHMKDIVEVHLMMILHAVLAFLVNFQHLPSPSPSSL